MSKKYITLFISLVLTTLAAHAQPFYVSGSGNDTNPGTLGEPFLSIQHGVSQLGPGDTLFIRGGSYHEEIILQNLSGAPDAAIVITNYQGEEVILDGTIPIETSWEVHQGSIFKTTIPEDIWQLFVDGRMQVVARWPNASTHPVDPITRNPGGWEPVHATWWSKSTTWANADAPGTINGVLEDNPGIHDLAATGLSFQGGSVLLSVLEQGGDGNQERLITHHEAGSNTFQHPVLFPPKPELAYRYYGKYYIVEHLNALDMPEEWYYIDSTNTVYLWSREGADPETFQIRGRNISRALTLTHADHIKIRGLNFFASNFSVLGKHVTFENCVYTYPDASKRLVGIYPATSTDASTTVGTYVDGEYFSLLNCVLRYTEYSVLKVVNGTGSLIDNNLFHHISMLGLGKNGAIEQVNTYTRNTMTTVGIRAAVKTNAGPSTGRIHTHNLFDGFGFLQTPDGAALQVGVGHTPNANRSYNWFLNSPKFGSRWDGRPAGVGGLNHHNVGVFMRGTLQVKGDEHHNYNNSSFDSDQYNDIILMSDPEFGGNEGTFTFNNLADRISGHRSEPVVSFPLPGTHGHNWNGYIEQSDANQQVRDVENRDFRPRPGSDLVDAGQEIPGITDGFLGNAPDIGAYEFGDTIYWIPGRKTRATSSPVPADKGSTHYEFVDLMWLEGYSSQSSDVYFGSTEADVESAGHGSNEFMGNRWNNIFNPGALQSGETFFCRIDAENHDSIIKGKVWSFTCGTDANPEIYQATFQVSGMINGVVRGLDGAEIRMDGRRATTNAHGLATFSMLPGGDYGYEISRNGFRLYSDSVTIHSDTTFEVRLIADHQAQIRVVNRVTGEPLNRAYIRYEDQLILTNAAGEAVIDHLTSGILVYRVEHNDFFSLSDSVEILSDTLLIIEMTPRLASIRFMISDGSVALPGATVRLNGFLTLIADSEGEVQFIHRPARTQYGYIVSKEGYEAVSDSFYLEVDTTLSIVMEPLTGLTDPHETNPEIYPNPATDLLRVTIASKEATVKLLSAEGKVLMEQEIFQGNNSLDLSPFHPGIYMVKIEGATCNYWDKLIIE